MKFSFLAIIMCVLSMAVSANDVLLKKQNLLYKQAAKVEVLNKAGLFFSTAVPEYDEPNHVVSKTQNRPYKTNKRSEYRPKIR
jgi:hypothetical protein